MRLINDFLDVDYRIYAREVVFKRSIPQFIDGFKDGGRKIFFYLNHNKNRFIKVSAIAGGIIERCDYHHGEVSAQNTIINMAKFYEGSNNLPIAIPEGHFGSKILKGSASARYIFASYNKLMDFIFLDEELTIKNNNDETPEPEFYIPIIPMNVVNGCTGIAIGYAINILPHHPISVIDFMIKSLQGKKTSEIDLFFHGCNYEHKKIDDLSYEISPAKIQMDKKQIIISELKPEMDREKFINVLIQLIENGQIKSFRDESKEQFKFTIKNIKLTPDNVVEKLQLVEKVKQNINLIENKTVKSFTSIEDFVTQFTNTRLTYYSKRKSYMKCHYGKLKSLNNALCCLIDNKTILIKSKSEINDFFLNKGIEKDILAICLSKSISILNENSKKKLLSEIKDYEEKIVYYDTIKDVDLYLKDLKILRKEIVKFYEKYDIT